MKTIWAIVIGLGGMLILSFVVVFVTMAHPPRPAPHKTNPSPCVCKGQCARKAGAP